MIDPSIAKWLPDDPELNNFYKGVDDFVTKYIDARLIKKYSARKVIIDPCVGYIEIQPWEITLLDSHIFQQLRKITQLGLAYLVFPTLRYSRFEHTLGVLGRLDQMLKKLQDKHKDDQDIVDLIITYETRLRLAALFHDVGHCLFSHLSESVINNLKGREEDDINSNAYYPSAKTIKEKFNSKYKTGKGSGLSIAEILSLVIMGSDAITNLLYKANLKEKVVSNALSSVNIDKIPVMLQDAANFIAGIPVHDKPKTAFLAQLISSGLDADKLDYMSREEHFSGIKVEMDLERILNKIKVHKVSTKRGLQKGLEKYAIHVTDSEEPYYVLCIERGGQFAYEEFCVARLALFEKVYLHKKVRAAEQTLKNKLEKLPAEIEEFNKVHNWLYLPESIVENETKISFTEKQEIKIRTGINLFGEEFISEHKEVPLNKELKIDLSFIEKRDVPHRAYAFGPANATYDNDYYSLLDSAKTNEDIEREIKNMLSVKFWHLLKDPEGQKRFIDKIKEELLNFLEFQINNPNKVKLDHTVKDLEHFKSAILRNDFENELIIDVPAYNRVILSFESLHFEESSFQSVRWTIPIHRISHYYQLHRILAYVYYDKKYCDLINLACEKATLDFIGKGSDERQVYEQKNNIAKDVYDTVQEIKTSIFKKNATYFLGYEELQPVNKSLNNDHVTDVINKVVQELNRYHSHKFKSDVKFQNVLNFLRQFPEDTQEFMLEILSSIKVLHESELESILEEIFKEISSVNKESEINVIPLGTSFSSATGMMKHFFPLLSKYNIGNYTIDDDNILDYDHFVFFDDNTNSGRQSLNIIARWCGVTVRELKDKKIYTNVDKNRDANTINEEMSKKLKDAQTQITLCFITGTTEAEDLLKKHLTETCQIKGKISIKIKYYLKRDYRLFGDECDLDTTNIFSVIKDDFFKVKSLAKSNTVAKTKKFLSDIGKQLVEQKDICQVLLEKAENHALGYCNRESTVIFYNSVPTSTFTALWCRGFYELPNDTQMREWIPLIPRER